MSATIVAAVLIVAAGALISGVAFRVALRLWPGLRNEDHSDGKAVYFSMVGVLYAILLAFVVVVAWEQFNAAEEATHTEATRLSNLLRDAQSFNQADRQRVQGAIVKYAQAVVDDEYETMADGHSSPRAMAAYEGIWTEFYGVDVDGEPGATFLGSAIGRLNELGEARRLRVLASQSTIPTPLWVLLIGGGLFTVAWLFPFYVGSVRAQTLAIATIGAFTGFVLFLVFALQHPFAGDVAIDSTVYQDLVDLWTDRR
jgi:hypothetical protein